MKKQFASTATALALMTTLCLAGCSSPAVTTTGTDSAASTPAVEDSPASVDLTGEWKQTNGNDPESFQSATITADGIEINWNAPDTKSLYWAGTVEQGEGDSFTWESVNDKSKTDSAMLASGDDTKTFTYENGEISYDVTAMGTIVTVRLAKQ